MCHFWFQCTSLMFSSTPTFVFLSIQYTLITHLQHHISDAPTSFLSAFRIALVSAPYCTVVNTNTFNSFTFVKSLMTLSFHIVFSPPIVALPIAIILRISLSSSRSFVTNPPRNAARYHFNNCLITITSPISPLAITFVFGTYRYCHTLSLVFLLSPWLTNK